MKPPNNILVDIGNVLFTFDFHPALRRLIPATTRDPEARISRLHERKDDFESGRIPEDEFIAWASECLGFHGDPGVFREIWCTIFIANQPMWDQVTRLKEAGCNPILFSNTNALHVPWLLANLPAGLFEDAVFSHLVGSLKPEPFIYHHAIERHKLDPARTLYLDDLAPNIETGRTLGLQCFQYDFARHDSCVRWIDERLAPPAEG